MFTLTRSTGPWACQLTLIRHQDPLSATFENVTGEPFGQALRSPAELPHALRAAALALVGPHATFSRDVICVNVHAADVPDLCVFDLPGMHGDRETRRLAKLCAQSPRTLVLLAFSCEGASPGPRAAAVDAWMNEAEPDNLAAVRLAREVDPTGGRTLGVLTKADRMDDTTPWARMLRGEEHPLMHGWFCPRESVALQQVLGIHAHHRVGRAAFVRKLDAVLGDITRQRVIELQTLATARLDALSDELARIPDSPSARGDARNEVFKLLLQFSGNVSQLVSSVSTTVDDTAFWSTVRNEQQSLRRELQRSAPKFIPWERACSVRDLQWLEDPASLANDGSAEFSQRSGEELFVDDVANLMAK
ncbi:hypothetical protein AURDEDRAFT_116816 [Auricularia subglabra TFB-10046 SS5]|uniref:Dynamin GTPase domain-containing protein n=1 Tax=Auricularia subglabra (strain TFB-10046 / SS5) TaxID=717982 RepID=J0CZU0_AURST|nr:hypothetical protein AURDEDRAFT_116816 [Auricularia subglabra TFB-10046 SS5]